MKIPLEVVLMIIKNLPLEKRFEYDFDVGYNEIELITANLSSFSAKLWFYAVISPHPIEVIKWLHQNDVADCHLANVMNRAARYGLFDVVKYLHYNRTEGCTTDALNDSAFFGYLEIARFLVENRPNDCDFDGAIFNAETGWNHEIAKYLNDRRS